MRRPALLLVVTASALAAPPATAESPRRSDVAPPGWSVPADAGNQAFEFGNCESRTHASGGWVCLEALGR
jgi:hypothetical protein